MKPFLLSFLVFGSLAVQALAQSSATSISSRLQKEFEGKILVIRSFYNDPSLHFDANGALESRSAQGFGPIDGSIHVRKVQFNGKSIDFDADTPIPVWDPEQKQVSWVTVRWKRRVSINATNITVPEDAINRVYKVFYRDDDVLAGNCTETEKRRFQESARKGIGAAYTISAQPENAKPGDTPAETLDQVPRSCYPTGEVAYTNKAGVQRPKEKHTPDPSYTTVGKNAGLTGRVDLMFIVNQQGEATSVIMLGKPLGAGLDEQTLKTMRSWRFAPATFKGEPIPTILFVEFHFDLIRR